MYSRKLIVSLLLLLPGCVLTQQGPVPAWSWAGLFNSAGSDARARAQAAHSDTAYSTFHFDWRLDGDPEIMPVQVFDDGVRTWLQFPSEGAWPAVFEAASGGWRPLSYRHEGPYMVIDGVYASLVLRGGHLQGRVERVGGREAIFPKENILRGSLPERVVPSTPARDVAAASEPAVPLAIPGVTPMPTAMVPQAVAVPDGQSVVQPSGAGSAAPAGVVFSVGPADVTMRQALERWARAAGWTFSPEHWAVDVDIPLVGQASFEADFRSAVREMLAATELGDRPLQPCFYSNRVLRVVALSQPCDRRKGMGAMS